MSKRNITVTKAYIMINIAVFFFIFLQDPQLSTVTLIDYGAHNPFSMADGRLLNFIMPMFLHASIQHLALNCLSIHIFGRFVEGFYGPKKFALISIFIGIFASLGSFLTGPKISVGASGVIYGYIAFHIYLYILDKDRYKSLFGRDIFILLGINIVYSLVGTNIDMAGHIFGLLGGLFIYILIDKIKIKKSTKALVALATSLVIILAAFSISSYKYSEDYYLSKIYYYEMKNKPAERDELINDYLLKFSN